MNSKYLLHGKLTTHDGDRDQLSDILIEVSQFMPTVKGCKMYLISWDEMELNNVYITEIWDSKSDHDASLTIPEVRNYISKAIPLLKEKPTSGQSLIIQGGIIQLTNNNE